MHPVDCPGWEYENHENAKHLPSRCIALLIALRRGDIRPDLVIHDSRATHERIFAGTTPDECEYFAGHYRGEPFRCLQYYLVRIPADPRVGVPPHHVDPNLQHLSDVINGGVAAIEDAFRRPNAQLPIEDKLYYLVVFACRVFVEFLRIHPYANGNGHMARFIIWLTLSKFGIWPRKWPLNDRPPDPPYSNLIKLYRDGQPQFLEKFVLQCVIG